MGQFDLRLLVARRGEKYQREATLFAVVTPRFDESELLAVEIERLVDIADTNHRMQILHESVPVAVVR